MKTNQRVQAIRILESDANRRGDLFARLMEGLVLALGYERVRLNIHKSGREIDIEAKHRTEQRQLIAECKATDDSIGGDEINKFVGSLDAERRKKSDIHTEGYFVSLSGFTETAIEQERDLGNRRVILLNATDVIRELIAGHVLIPEQKALERAGRCAATCSPGLVPIDANETLAHEIGWVWALYFESNKQRTHFSLVHADGNFISASLAKDVIAADKSVGGSLHLLQYLEPPADSAPSEELIASSREHYFAYLGSECGEIQLEGLPADQDVGSRRLILESIFVPLHLRRAVQADPAISSTVSPNRKTGPVAKQQAEGSSRGQAIEASRRVSVGEVIATRPRIAVLGLPGGGKSTLLKRLAIAYAFPERRKLIEDRLPPRQWLPLFIRCRQLGKRARSAIIDSLFEIPTRAEMTTELAEGFKILISRELRYGHVLLLVDGLDEISDDGDRISFVHQLRTFLAIYPNVALVVSSREAGFRVIGGALSAECEHFRLDDFNRDDIVRLTIAWHREVLGTTAQIRLEAKNLAEEICANDRLFKLAANPLLLTTLLLVKRWVGQLPPKRTVLYSKAIEVLLMTWNVQGHQPLDQDEVLPQLEYLAFWMMDAGLQAISGKRLQDVLTTARKQMPEILGWADQRS